VSPTGSDDAPRQSGAAGDGHPERVRVAAADEERCDWCGSSDTWWHNCKLLCRNCGAIAKSCADL